MSNLSMVEAELPPGFRFHPRDEELICDYLMKKVMCSECPLMVEVDLNKCEPWDIPEMACVGGKEWYFYSQRDRKYATGLRTNRATVSGYWKATGKDRTITGRGGTLVGMRKTLVFYQGRAPKGRKTEWVMHEFRLEGPLGPPKISSPKEDWVLCRVFYKNRSEVPGKQGMGRGYDGARSSSSLPPLMDSYITFDDPQTRTNITNNENEQVPCFSLFTPNQMINPNIAPISSHMEPSISSAKSSSGTSKTTFGGIPDVGACLYPLSCDQKVLKEVLGHLTSPPNIRGLPSLGNEGSSEGFLSDVGFASMLSHYYCS